MSYSVDGPRASKCHRHAFVQLRKIWLSLSQILGCVHPNKKNKKKYNFLMFFVCACFNIFISTFYCVFAIFQTVDLTVQENLLLKGHHGPSKNG